MIKFCIIEDEESQYNLIEKNITTRFEELGRLHTFSWRVSGIKCWEHEYDEFLKKYKDLDPDIVILDYDLFWGQNKESFDGDKIFNKIFNTKSIQKPFIIFTSLKFAKEEKGFPESIIEGNVTTEYYDTCNKSKFLDLIFKEAIDKALLNAIQRVLKIRPQIYLKTFEYPKSYILAGGFLKPKYEIPEILFYERNVIGFSTSPDQKVIIFILDDDNNISIKLLDVGRKPTKALVFNLLKEHNFNQLVIEKGFVYNSSLIRKKNEDKFIFNAEKINFESYKKFNEFITQELNYTKRLQKDDKQGKKETDINPFYNMFKKFDFSELW